MTDATMTVGMNQPTVGSGLKAKLARAERMNKRRAFLLVAPLLAFVVIFFIVPIGDMLFRSVDNRELSQLLPNTHVALRDWDPSKGLPDEPVYVAFAEDLRGARENRTFGKIGTRLNFESSGMRSAVNTTSRAVARLDAPPPRWKEFLIDADDTWGRIEKWGAIRNAIKPYTGVSYLNSFDLRLNEFGAIVAQPEERRIYGTLFLRTLEISLLVTALCVLLGFPVSYLLANLPLRYSNLLMILVLLPFWTSLLVRTTAWIALLQSEGIVNDVLVWTGVIANDGRLQMMYNKTGTIVVMVHILLPFMILPIYSVMRTIPASYMRAALSLGARPSVAFARIYLPQTVPGVAAGCMLVFILAVGYYITPALVGGQDGTMISNFIAFHMRQSLNWQFAAALGAILLLAVMILYWLFNKLIGVDRLKFG